MADRKKSIPAAAINRRRGFLFSLGAGGIAAAAAVLKPVSEAVPEAALSPPAPEPGAGYRETSHVRDYYRTTKL